MSGAEADNKMSRPMVRRELTTMQMAKQLSRRQIRLPDWTREISAKMKPYGSGRLCMGERVNHAATGMWSWINQAATKIWGRDLQEPVSSLVLAVVGETSPDLFYYLVCHGNEQDYYLRPWSILHQESDGRSWVMNNTSNLPEVE